MKIDFWPPGRAGRKDSNAYGIVTLCSLLPLLPFRFYFLREEKG